METNERRRGLDRRRIFRMFQFLERRQPALERRQDAVDAWGEPIEPWTASPPLAHKRVYPAEV